MNGTDLNLILEKIKSKISLSEVIGKDVHLTHKGREYVGNCPFHNEKTASFFVNDEKGTYYCFGCGASGDIVEYLMKSRGITFSQAIEQLSQISGVDISKFSKNVGVQNIQQKILHSASEYFEGLLLKNKRAMEYCEKRGISDDEIRRIFHIGYCDMNISGLARYLKEQGFEKYDILKSGLFSYINNSYDLKFKDRIIFPVQNKRGWTIGFGGRSLSNDVHPKYLNSKESPIFKKKEILYGYNIAIQNVSKENPFIVVEGYMDVVIMHKFGFKTSIASMGTSFSEHNLYNIWKYCSEPIICFDGDKAGYNAMIRLAFLSLQYIEPGKSLKFCILPEGDDPDSFLKNNSTNDMRYLLDNPKHMIDFLWDYFVGQYDLMEIKTPENIAKWKKDIGERIMTISNRDIRKLYIDDIKERIYNFLHRKKNNNYKNFTRNHIVNDIKVEIDRENKELLREAFLLYTLIKKPSIMSYIVERLSNIEFQNKRWQKVCDSIIEKTQFLDDIPQTPFSLDDEFEEDLKEIEKFSEKLCKIDECMTDEDIVGLWDDVYDIHMSRKMSLMDLREARVDFENNDLNEDKWRRLRALKMKFLDNNNNKKS